jgi:hypothetical protein
MTETTHDLAQETVLPDEGLVATEFIAFLKAASEKHHPTGPLPRFNQGRAAGCVDAEFIVSADLPIDLSVGLFAAPRTYAARIRFGHASTDSDREKDVRGMSIKVLGVAGDNLTPGATTQDFVLNSHPVMMVGGTADFLELLRAHEEGGARQAAFFAGHPHAGAVALASRQHATSHLEISYWSTTPYLFGPRQAVKYVVRPVSNVVTPLPDPLTDNYLRDRLVAHLAKGEALFDLMVQFRTDPEKMPIEDASVEWKEHDSPYRTVARIRIPPQNVGSPGQSACEGLSFNPWHALPDHRPLGNYNRARKTIYQTMAAFRQQAGIAEQTDDAGGTDGVSAKSRSDKEWYELPRLIAGPRLVAIRNQLRRENLIDTEEPTLQKRDIPADLDPTLREGRTVDGSYNDLSYPLMGSCGRRFGRNVPLEHAQPDIANLMTPNPRVVSRELMTRHEFQPATILNLLAAAWIQFMVHDWFVHKRSTMADGIDIPLAPGDDWSDRTMRIPRSVPDAAPSGSTRPPAYVNPNSHWWDGSQIYGSDPVTAAKLRTNEGGKLKIEPTNLLSVDPETGIHLSGFTENWWIGLAMLHTIFVCEHNYLCDLLANEHPRWNDAQIFVKAELINSALMAKIHTVEWTPAILPNPLTQIAMNVNWHGLAGDELQEVFRFLNDQELAGGIIGSPHDHHGAPYALTEEFVSVYRMHPLIPDDLVVRSHQNNQQLASIALPEMSGRRTPGIADRFAMTDLFYSFGVSFPGAVTLHNYPRHLQNLTRDDGEHLDLAAVDIFRDRERGVPRYNRFRTLLHKKPIASFDELTDNKRWREEIRRVYNNDIDQVDLMTGLYAEPLPPGFGFSDTAFRIFILMASRRLKSDRFFTDDYRADFYTELGIQYLKDTSMLTLLNRHYPELKPALAGVTNAFQPWKPTNVKI